MKQIIIILLIALSYLSVEAKDTTTIEKVITQTCATQVDTVKFVNDTAWVAETPNVSHIVYADNSSSANIIGEYLFPIIMLLLGIGIDRFIVWRGEKNRVQKAGKRWMAELRGIIEPIKKQQNSLLSFITEYCDKPEQAEVPNVAVFSTANGSKFGSFGKEDLYEYIETLKGINSDDTYQNICSIIYSLELTHRQFTDSLNDFRNRGSKLIEEYNSHIQQYRNFLLDVVLTSGAEGMGKKDANELMSIYNAIFKDEGRSCNVYKSIDEFINPSIKVLNRYKSNEITRQMIHILSSCYDCVVGMKNEKVYIKANFMQAYIIYESTIVATNDVLKLFDNKK